MWWMRLRCKIEVGDLASQHESSPLVVGKHEGLGCGNASFGRDCGDSSAWLCDMLLSR